jgi:hypothetical protein
MFARLRERLSRTNLAGALGLAIVLWACTLIPIGLIVWPLFGSRVALIVASGLLVASVALCWGFYASHPDDGRI